MEECGMLISKTLNKALNEQIGDELMASNQYLNIASYFDSETLPELADFFFRQSDEERMHALKILRYVLDAGGTVAIPELEEPTKDITTAEMAAKLALDWE
jgi:ferritin